MKTQKKFKGYREIFTDEFGKYKAMEYDMSCEGCENWSETDLQWAIRGGSVVICDTVFRGKKYGPKKNTTISRRYL